MNEKFETHEHDVLIIGAGGAGLTAAIEALGHGASVAVVCKSLLGKAHTVMAEGGIAAAMANVDAADDWRTHFRDTMRGGKFLNKSAGAVGLNCETEGAGSRMILFSVSIVSVPENALRRVTASNRMQPNEKMSAR